MKELSLAFVSVVVALIAIIPQGARADIGTTSPDVGTLVQQLLQKYDPVFDGTLTFDDPPPFGDTIHVVDRDNKDAWKIQVDTGGAVTFDNEMSCDSANGPPLPPGALHLVVFPGDSHAYLRSTRYHHTYLRDLTRLDYYACDQMNNGQQWPYIILNIDWNGDNVRDDLIFFEPAYQNTLEGGTCGTNSAQGPEILQTWQFWDALKIDSTTGDFLACYWAVSSTFVANTGTVGCGPGSDVCSLSEYIRQHPDAAIVNFDGNHGGVRVAHGDASPGDLFDGWVDAFTIGKEINTGNGKSHSTVTYDFQKP